MHVFVSMNTLPLVNVLIWYQHVFFSDSEGTKSRPQGRPSLAAAGDGPSCLVYRLTFDLWPHCPRQTGSELGSELGCSTCQGHRLLTNLLLELYPESISSTSSTSKSTSSRSSSSTSSSSTSSSLANGPHSFILQRFSSFCLGVDQVVVCSPSPPAGPPQSWRCLCPDLCPWRPSAGCFQLGRRSSCRWRTCYSLRWPGRSPTKVRPPWWTWTWAAAGRDAFTLRNHWVIPQ